MGALALQAWFKVLAGIVAAGLLARAALWGISWLQRCAAMQRDLAGRIDGLLPQTQCGQCGYPGCRPYAEAIARGDAINKCPPGGARTIAELARLLGEPVAKLDPRHGTEGSPLRAVIREAECIGCTKCIQVCPVDAILGAPKLMHTVIESECTGCELCVAPCPVDCIDLQAFPRPATAPWPLAVRAQSGASPAAARGPRR